MANVEDLEFETQIVEGFFNELEDTVRAKITESGVYMLTKTKDDPAIFIDAIKVKEVPGGLSVENGRITFEQTEADYIYVKFSTE